MNVRRIFVISSVITTALIIVISIFVTPVWWLFIIAGPLILMGIFDMIQKKHAIRRQHINRRVGMHHIAKYDEIYLPMEKGSLLKKGKIPVAYKRYFTETEVRV